MLLGVVHDMQDSPEDQSAAPIDEALASFVLLAQFLGVPAEAAQIHHDRGQGDKSYDFDDLIRVAKKLGLMARRRSAALAELPRMPLPALVSLGNGGTAILLKVDNSSARYLVLTAVSERPEIWSEGQVLERFAWTDDKADLLCSPAGSTSRGKSARSTSRGSFQRWSSIGGPCAMSSSEASFFSCSVSRRRSSFSWSSTRCWSTSR